MGGAASEGFQENESARHVTPLVSLFRAELRALDAYTIVLRGNGHGPYGVALWREKARHADRALLLLGRIRELHVSAPSSDGPWESIAALDETAPIALFQALAKEEAQLARDYEAILPFIDSASRRMVAERLVAAQASAYRIVAAIADEATRC